jgi:PucR family transcriptional regulator, purine catabolism regulatory protein
VKALIDSNVNIQNDDTNSEPMIKIPSSAFGALRRELIDTLGSERAKGFLRRYGWNCGVTDTIQLQEREWENPKDLILAGPRIHTLNGHVQVEPIVCEVDFDKGTLHFEGEWVRSNEAQEHIKIFGYSEESVCHSLVGYASGYLSTIMGKKVITKETQCVAMGHEHCHWVSKTVEEWNGDSDIEKEIYFYEADRMYDELEETYDKLRVERDSLSRTYDVHLKLFKEVVYETGLQSMTNIWYETMRMPLIIETLDCEIRAVAGISMEEATKYSSQFKEWLEQDNKKKEMNQTNILDIAPGYKRVISPIYFRQNIQGYCSFLTEANTVSEADKMILGQFSLACSLHLLNERTRINTEQQLRGSFLEAILSKRITKSEIVDRAHYIDFELSAPYFMVAIHRQFEESSINKEMEFNDQFMNDLLKFLKTKGVNGLLGQKSGNIIILFSESMIMKSHLKKESLCQQTLDYCMTRYPKSLFEMGVSSSSPSIEKASQLYDESIASLKVTNYHQNLVFFDSLGIIGMLLQAKDLETIENFANKILGDLVEEDQAKNMELTKTLYHYLENGSNVHQTARSMNFSISGLRYRLGRLNEILQLDMSKAYTRHEIYLALQALMVIGKLEID